MRACCMISNSTAIAEVMSRIDHKFDLMSPWLQTRLPFCPRSPLTMSMCYGQADLVVLRNKTAYKDTSFILIESNSWALSKYFAAASCEEPHWSRPVLGCMKEVIPTGLGCLERNSHVVLAVGALHIAICFLIPGIKGADEVQVRQACVRSPLRRRRYRDLSLI